MSPLVSACINLLCSESGEEAKLLGEPPGIYEPWPEMDALAAALDKECPAWRVIAVDRIKQERGA